jgi:hypothetical protein
MILLSLPPKQLGLQARATKMSPLHPLLGERVTGHNSLPLHELHGVFWKAPDSKYFVDVVIRGSC